MKGALIPLAMALLGAGAGAGAALVLAPGTPDAAPHGEEAPHGEAPEHGAEHPPEAAAVEPGSGAKADGHDAGGHGAAADEASAGHDSGGHGSKGAAGDDYVKLDSQFVVPVIEEGRTTSLVVLALSLEVEPGAGAREAVFAQEPRLRDALLRVLFDHANAGGFSGGFTREGPIERLRSALRERARAILGPDLRDVLILDIARQDA